MHRRRGRESNPRIEVLQTPALPLGYHAWITDILPQKNKNSTPFYNGMLFVLKVTHLFCRLFLPGGLQLLRNTLLRSFVLPLGECAEVNLYTFF